jgi:hypothetical protein
VTFIVGLLRTGINGLRALTKPRNAASSKAVACPRAFKYQRPRHARLAQPGAEHLLLPRKKSKTWTAGTSPAIRVSAAAVGRLTASLRG